jgi:hypothetical protein
MATGKQKITNINPINTDLDAGVVLEDDAAGQWNPGLGVKCPGLLANHYKHRTTKKKYSTTNSAKYNSQCSISGKDLMPSKNNHIGSIQA